jgi:hypothetical protein
MASYMFLFTFTMILFLTDARPSYRLGSGIREYNRIMNSDENNRFFNERQPRILNQLPEYVLVEYGHRHFRQ